MSNAERQRRWLEKNRAAFNLRRRNARKGKLDLGLQEAKVGVDVPRTEMPLPEKPFETKKVGEFRMVVLPEEKPAAEVPETTDTRSRSDIAMGIWRNDQGGVISKFAYDKLQKLKEKAKTGGYEFDDYSQ